MRLLTFSLLAAMLALPVAAQHATGIDLSGMDHSVSPGEDFYRFVNGLWLARTEIPADRSRFGAFDELSDAAREHVRDIIEEVAAGKHADDPDAQRIAAAYLAFMDVDRVEALGLDPLAIDFERVDAVETAADLPRYFAESQWQFGPSPIGIGVGQDQRNAEQYTVTVSQGGLGLPDRSYYLEDRWADVRDAYVAYVGELFTLAGTTDDAEAVLAFETRLAEHHWDRVQNRDREATYNKMALVELEEAHPSLRFSDMIELVQLEVDSLVVRQPSYLEALDRIVAEVPVDQWQAWMRARLLDSAAPLLSEAFRDAHFGFRGRTLSGQEEPEPRWRQAVAFSEGAVGEAIGRLYVARHYPPEAESRMAEMIENLRDAFRESITELDWMADATRAEALAKLDLFNVKIGYPEEWRDYSTLELGASDLVGNARALARFRHEEAVSRLGEPVDRKRWFMTPQTVNAYYSSTMNEIVFPAAILQPPFFNVEADDAVNYGGIGAVIGHEFSHGFDDQGRRSDGHGNLRDWWTEEDAAEYTRRAQMLIDQYDAYEPLEGQHIIGAQTIGENIADLAGLTMAYRAYRRSLGGEEAPVIDGLTGDQRFFMGWAQVWRILWREPRLRQQLQTGGHSPGEYRTNGIVIHLDAFHEAFDTQPGDPMWLDPEERIRIW